MGDAKLDEVYADERELCEESLRAGEGWRCERERFEWLREGEDSRLEDCSRDGAGAGAAAYVGVGEA